MTTSQAVDVLADIAKLDQAMLLVVGAAREVLTAKRCLFPWRSFGHEDHGAGGCDLHRYHVLKHAISQLDELAAQEAVR